MLKNCLNYWEREEPPKYFSNKPGTDGVIISSKLKIILHYILTGMHKEILRQKKYEKSICAIYR